MNAQAKKSIEIESSAEFISEPLNLMQLLDDEIQDLYTGASEIRKANSKEDKLIAKQALGTYLESRIDTLITLNNVAMDLIKQRKEEILKLTELSQSEKGR